MADGLIKDLLGEGAEDAGVEEAHGLPPELHLANAMAHSRASGSKEARAYLADARRMIQLQIETLHEERLLSLHHMKARRWRDGLLLAFQFLGVGIVAVLGFGVAVMMWDAFTSRRVVVDAFGAPPALAARGLSGAAVAEGFLDQLTVLQSVTHSQTGKRHLANAWTGDIKIEVPETGVSIADLDRILKSRFGHDLHIGGELVQDETGGLDLTVRGDGVLPKTFVGGPADLEKLQTQAAEYVFGQAEPSLFAVYLYNAGRPAEAVAFAKSAYASDLRADRPYLLNAWGVALQITGAPPEQSLELFRTALKLKPDYWVAYNNVMNGALQLGREEQALRAGGDMMRAAGGRPGRSPEKYYQNVDFLTWNLLQWRAEVLDDLESSGGVGTGLGSNRLILADIDQRLHDPAAADLDLQTTRPDPNDSTHVPMTHYDRGQLAWNAGDLKTAATEMEAFGVGYAIPAMRTNFTGYDCWIAPVEEAAGHPERADAVLKTGGSFVDCYRFKADILDHRGDWKGAQAQYAAAVALAPDLPAAEYSWGLALARHGDLAGAQAKLMLANTKGPHWADPLKAMGDVLARKGRWRDALARYDQAMKLAPAWAELKQARAAAAARAGA